MGLDVWPEPLDQSLNVLSPLHSHVEDAVDEIKPARRVDGCPPINRSCEPALNVV
jgi:hypothetical protein